MHKFVYASSLVAVAALMAVADAQEKKSEKKHEQRVYAASVTEQEALSSLQAKILKIVDEAKHLRPGVAPQSQFAYDFERKVFVEIAEIDSGQ